MDHINTEIYQTKYAVQMAETARCECEIDVLKKIIQDLQNDLLYTKKMNRDLANEIFDYQQRKCYTIPIATPSANAYICHQNIPSEIYVVSSQIITTATVIAY